MSTEISPRQIYFHDKYAMNLAQNALDEGLARRNSIPKTQKQSVERILLRGNRDGWIRSENQRLAREMFVFSDQVLLPGFAEFVVNGGMGKDGHVALGHNMVDDYILKFIDINSFSLSDDDTSIFQQLIKADLTSKGYFSEASRIGQILRRWEYFQRDLSDEDVFYQRYHKVPKTLDREFNIINDAHVSCVDTIMMTGLGFPVFTEISMFSDMAIDEPKKNKIPNAVSVYFTESLLSPSPRTLRQAIKLRENKLINEWRQKIIGFSNDLATGKLTEVDLKREIKEANDYIKGADYASRLIPKWTVLLTLPAGIAAQFVPGLQGLGMIGIGVGVIQLHSWLAEKSVKSSGREKYRWLMVSNSK